MLQNENKCLKNLSQAKIIEIKHGDYRIHPLLKTIRHTCMKIFQLESSPIAFPVLAH